MAVDRRRVVRLSRDDRRALDHALLLALRGPPFQVGAGRWVSFETLTARVRQHAYRLERDARAAGRLERSLTWTRVQRFASDERIRSGLGRLVRDGLAHRANEQRPYIYSLSSAGEAELGSRERQAERRTG